VQKTKTHKGLYRQQQQQQQKKKKNEKKRKKIISLLDGFLFLSIQQK
jgi:hypothetical protein